MTNTEQTPAGEPEAEPEQAFMRPPHADIGFVPPQLFDNMAKHSASDETGSPKSEEQVTQ